MKQDGSPAPTNTRVRSGPKFQQAKKLGLISGKHARNRIAGDQTHKSNRCGSTPQVFAYVASHVQAFPDALAKLADRIVELPPLIGCPLFKHIHRDTICHAVLASFWIQT